MKTLSFVIPVYNEEHRLVKTFYALTTFQPPKGSKLEKVVFVNDGSTDQSAALIRRFIALQPKSKRAKYTLISYKHNHGKGYAVARGMVTSQSDYTLFFDADMSTPLTQLKKLMPFMAKHVDVIVGTRRDGKSTVIEHQPFYREFLGKGFTKLTQISLGMDISDFTCGFKAFSRNAVKEIFPYVTIERWGYDAEILFLAHQHKLTIAEKAVTWSNDRETKVKLHKAIPQTISDIVMIRLRHTIKPTLALRARFVTSLVKLPVKSVH